MSHSPHIEQLTKLPLLKFKPRQKYAEQRLPFVDRHHYWDVPNAGGYGGGCLTGKALAMIYLKHLREHSKPVCGLLQHIALSMQEPIDTPGSARRGQVVGFFAELERCLVAAAQQLAGGLDNIDPKQLLKQANAGLQFVEKRDEEEATQC